MLLRLRSKDLGEAQIVLGYCWSATTTLKRSVWASLSLSSRYYRGMAWLHPLEKPVPMQMGGCSAKMRYTF
jgi:hypothetical protein